MNWLIALKYLAAIVSIVKQLEIAMPDSPGKEKLDKAIMILSSTSDGVQGVLPEVIKLFGTVKAAFFPKPDAPAA